MTHAGGEPHTSGVLRWALAWAVLFTAMHGYWYAGGTIGLGDAPSPLPGVPTSVGGWIFSILVASMFAAGIAVPVLLLRGRVSGRWRRTFVVLLWVGAVILVLRGATGLVDDLLRQFGLAEGGLTGLSYERTLGTADPSTYTLVSTDAVDAYFLLGGVIFGLAVRRGRRHPADPVES